MSPQKYLVTKEGRPDITDVIIAKICTILLSGTTRALGRGQTVVEALGIVTALAEIDGALRKDRVAGVVVAVAKGSAGVVAGVGGGELVQAG